jgi:hypothetical protein
MSYSKDEARLAIVEQIAWVLTYINTDDTSSDEEVNIAFDDMLDLAAIISASLEIEVVEVQSEETALVQIKLKDGEKFIEDMLKKEF